MDDAAVKELGQKLIDLANSIKDYSCELDGYEESDGKHQFRVLKSLYCKEPHMVLAETVSSKGNYQSRAKSGARMLYKEGAMKFKVGPIPIAVDAKNPLFTDKRGNKFSETSVVSIMVQTGKKMLSGEAVFEGKEEKDGVSCLKFSYPMAKKKPTKLTVFVGEKDLTPVHYDEAEVENPSNHSKWSVKNLEINKGLDKKAYRL